MAPQEDERLSNLMQVAMGDAAQDDSSGDDEANQPLSPGGNSAALKSARKFLWDMDEESSDQLATSGQTTMEMNKPPSPEEYENSEKDRLKSVFLGGPKPQPPVRRTVALDPYLEKSLAGKKGVDQSVNLHDPNSRRRSSRFSRTSLTSSLFGLGDVQSSLAFLDAEERNSEDFKSERDRRRKLSCSWGALVCMGVVIFAAVVVVMVVFNPLSADPKTIDKGPGTTFLPALPNNDRLAAITKRIIDSGLVNESNLNSNGTPQNEALLWINNQDPANLEVDDEYLLQRFALAVFFFSTSGVDAASIAESSWTVQEHWYVLAFCF